LREAGQCNGSSFWDGKKKARPAGPVHVVGLMAAFTPPAESLLLAFLLKGQQIRSPERRRSGRRGDRRFVATVKVHRVRHFGRQRFCASLCAALIPIGFSLPAI
jgi:hypothetical protein